MKHLILLTILSLSLSAQAIAPETLYLNEAQLRRLNETQARIVLAQKELEAATEVQKRVLVEIQLELGALPDKYEPLAQHQGKWGFKKKVEKK